MIKKLLLVISFAMAAAVSHADEGMWLPSLIGSRIKDMRSKGFRLTAEDIYSVNRASMKDAVVLFGGGCTGEFVSAEGLLLTNHHCGYGAIQQLSSVANDYLTDGFWAPSREGELPVPGLSVSILVRMEDVTARVAAGEKPADIVAEAEKEGHKADVQQMYYGNQQFLFVYDVFSDVRLVGAPPSSIGKFGGDTDNWVWPRHTGDFSVFRVYAGKDNRPAGYSKENRPYRPRRHFTISTRGVEEGDFTMIYGFPGSTQEYVTSDAVEYVAEVSDPMKIALRTQRLDIIAAAQARDAAVRIQYASKHASIANAWKKWQGEVLGLRRLGTAAKKRAYEREFAAWASSRPEYAHLLDSIHAAYEAVRPEYYVAELYSESVGAIEVFGRARGLAGTRSRMKDDAEFAGTANSSQAAFLKNYNADIDRAIAKRMIAEFMERMPEGGVPAEFAAAVSSHGGVDGYVDWLFGNTALTHEKFTAAEFDADPVVRMVAMFAPLDKRLAAVRARNLSDIASVRRWYTPYMQALMEWDTDRAFFPDANLTLRVAYGSVAGYDYADAVYHRHVSTLEGVIEKDNPEIYDYDVPQLLRDIHAAKDYGRWGCDIGGRRTVPVCFIATNHTSGGNSGSPVLNGRGELVGINFDRTWLSTMSDMEFDPDVCRNIAVDIRYVLFVMDRIGGASYLLEEMDIR
ncbi:MAG: S46 family peptidase [Alistipes sp.]|nr:S46 family peptidase [Alistipes sp.]